MNNNLRNYIIYKVGKYIPDYIWVQLRYLQHFHRFANLKNPRTVSEKLQWLKLYDRKTIYTIMADKFRAREYIQERIGDEYLVPLLGVWDGPDEIDFDALPRQFVLKCNHNSGGGMFICRDKNNLDRDKICAGLRRALKYNYFYESREWSYKNIKPKIICEKYLTQKVGGKESAITDYKFYCYGGEPQYFMYSVGETEVFHKNHKFDMKCNSIDYLFKKKSAIDVRDICLPENMGEMINIVTELCKGFPFIRIDLYNVSGKIYFGEFTFYSGGGFIDIENEKYMLELADKIDLSMI